MQPRMRSVLLWALLALVWPGSAAAQTSKSVLEAFGYVGQWAQDCSRKPEPGNPHMIVSVLRSGGIEMRNKLGPDYEDNVNIVLEARSLGPDRVWIKSQLNSNELREWEVTREGGRIRTFTNRKPDGTHITKDGVIVNSGRPTPWLNRCR